MIYKYTFSISSDSPVPESIWGELRGDFKRVDEKSDGTWISFWHPRSFATEDHIAAYDEAFVGFLEENQDVLIEHGAHDLEIYVEIYFDGGQCNFEAFNRDQLARLARLNVALPISIYVLEPEYLEEWEKEIRAEWSGESGGLGDAEIEGGSPSDLPSAIRFRTDGARD